MEQVYKFRKPMANYQVAQNTLLKHKWVHTVFIHWNRGAQIAEARSTRQLDFVPNICGLSVWNLVHVTLLVPRIAR
jgi:hypothetical protein